MFWTPVAKTAAESRSIIKAACVVMEFYVRQRVREVLLQKRALRTFVYGES